MSPKGNRVKFQFGKDMRAISLQQLTFSELLSTLEELLEVPRQRLILKYQDEEGDSISLCSEPEFEEALNCFVNMPLRLFVELKEEAESQSGAGSLQPEEIFVSNNSTTGEEPVEVYPVNFLEELLPIDELEPSTPEGIAQEGLEKYSQLQLDEFEYLLQQEEQKDTEPVVADVQQEEILVCEQQEEGTSPAKVKNSSEDEEVKTRNRRKKRQSKKQHQREKKIGKERKKEAEREKKREARGQLKRLRNQLNDKVSENKLKTEELRDGLQELENKESELLNELKALGQSIAEQKHQLRLHKKDSQNQLKALRQQIQVLETEISESKDEDETYPEVESADIVQVALPAVVSHDPEDVIQVYQNPRKKSDGKLKAVRFDLNTFMNDLLLNDRDRDEELEHFEKEITVLTSMGFRNVNKNLSLLRKFQGNLEHVVDGLVSAYE